MHKQIVLDTKLPTNVLKKALAFNSHQIKNRDEVIRTITSRNPHHKLQRIQID